MAKTHTAMSDSFDLFITDIMISKLLEYLKARRALSTRRALAILSKRSNLNPLLIRTNDGNIEMRSIMAIGENGYLTNDNTDDDLNL